MFNHRHLWGFVSVVESGNLSRAAGHLHISQPALSQGVGKLERQLGLPLLDRTGATLVPTSPGQLLHDRVVSAGRHLENGARETGVSLPVLQNFSHAQLRIFIAVVGSGRFKEAATALGLDTSTVNRTFRQFEQRIGIKALERTTNGIQPTRAATILERHIKLALLEFHFAIEDIAHWRGQFSGRIEIGSVPLFQAHVLPEAIRRFSDEFPKVTIAVVDGFYDQLARQLLHGKIDLFLSAMRGTSAPPEIREVTLFTEQLIAVTRKEHPLADKAGTSTRDLLKFPFVAPQKGAPARAYFDRLVAEGDPNSTALAPIETSNPAMVRSILCNSDRIAFISSSVQVSQELSEGVLKRLDVRLSQSDRQMGYAYRRDFQLTLAQERFAEILQDVMGTT